MKEKYLGIDHGTKRIGVAGTDALGIAAHALETVDGTDEAAGIARIGEIAAEREVVRLVVGLPLNMDGSEGEQVAKARAFGAKLAAATGLPVEFFDERLTSIEAEETLRAQGLSLRDKTNREKIDAIAAQLMLADYLAAHPPAELDE